MMEAHEEEEWIEAIDLASGGVINLARLLRQTIEWEKS